MKQTPPRQRRVGLLTCADYPELDGNENLVIAPLAALGIVAEPVVWSSDADFAAFDALVIRTTWDYAARRDEFLAFLNAQPHVLNPAPLVAWNTDKRYLRELSAHGVHVVPTEFLEPGTPLDADQLRDLHGTSTIVIKPSVGAGSVDAGKYNLLDAADVAAAQVLTAKIHSRGAAAMVQPYLTNIDSEQAETALMYFNGEFSHAIRKGALLQGPAGAVDGLFVKEQIDPRTPSAEQLAFGAAVLAAATTCTGSDHKLPFTYARVDLVQDNKGTVTLMELELTEPSLFFEVYPDHAKNFAAAIAAQLDIRSQA